MTYGVYPAPAGPAGPPGPGVSPLYGSFTGNSTQPLVVGGTVLGSLDLVEASNGITLAANAIRVPTSGIFVYNYSAQLVATANVLVSIWILINGNPLLRSNSNIALSGSSRIQIPFVEYVLPLNANDTVSVAFSTDGACSIAFIPPQVGPVRPETPALIVNCYRIG